MRYGYLGRFSILSPKPMRINSGENPEIPGKEAIFLEKILVIDDDYELCDLLQEYLEPEGFEIQTAHNGKEGLEKALSGEFDLVVLDIMLPEQNGFDVLRHLRNTSEIPVIMLTARGEDVDRIVGLEMGADDYLPKPFNPRELTARIRSILRRARNSHSDGDDSVLAVGDVELHRKSHSATCGGNSLRLTGVEFRFLHMLLENAGSIVSRQALAQKVLERSYSPFDRSVDVHISNIRKKMGPLPEGEERIKTIRGEGYLYVLKEESER